MPVLPKIKTREALVGIVVYRLAKYAVRRTLRKGGGMAKKRTAVIASLGALLGALFFWRRKKKHGEPVES